MTTYKLPPTYAGKDYSQWKSEVELWQMFTEMDKTRQGLALAFYLEGKAREIAISIDKFLLTTEDGVKNVLSWISYLKRKRHTRCMKHIQNLKLKKKTLSMLDYIIKFE